MKIIIIDPTSTSPPYCNYLSSSISKLGHEVCLIGPEKDIFFEKISAFDSRPFFPDYVSKNNFFRLLFYPLSLIQILIKVFKDNVSIVHFQWSHIPLIEFIFIKFIKKKVKVVYTAHNTLLFHGEKHLLRRFLQIGRELYLKQVDQVIVHTVYSKETLLKYYPFLKNKIQVIPYGQEEFLRAEEKEKFERSFSLNTKQIPHLLFFGQVSYYKGVDILIEAVTLLGDLDFTLNICGRPEIKKDLIEHMVISKNLSEKVNLDLRFLPNHEVHRYFLESDILVFPYRHIDQSSVLMSSFIYGKSLVASRIGGFIETIKDHENGLLFESENPQDLADKLRVVLTSKQIRNKLGSNNIQLSKILPDWIGIARKTLDLYYDCS